MGVCPAVSGSVIQGISVAGQAKGVFDHESGNDDRNETEGANDPAHLGKDDVQEGLAEIKAKRGATP